ncbi:hypothetical protein C8F04DRAFT_1270742 [Mycena alexandri]|uniref:Uncharacterized protein n=1 Tax=Mycena alexandri TaxID=1745969 RepID=A0AAD6WUM9_9AGAR|nr:hypothetical protein C8F04DRAFT_1270742 [Mycena alexandri]
MSYEASYAQEGYELQRSAIALSLEEEDDYALKPGPSTISTTVQRGAKRRLSATSDDEEHVQKKRKKEVEFHNLRPKEIAIQMQKNKTPKVKTKRGALRMTRTPGRRLANTLNTLFTRPHPLRLSLRRSLLFVLLSSLRNKRAPTPLCPMHIGRDYTTDGLGKQYADSTKKRPKSLEEFDRVVKKAQEGYRKYVRGELPRVLPVHEERLPAHKDGGPRLPRLPARGYHVRKLDFPRISAGDQPKYAETKFECQLKQHIEQLGCPEESGKGKDMAGRW